MTAITSGSSGVVRGRIRAARGEQGRLKRIRSAIPIVARRRRLTQERDALGDVIRLRDDFGDEFRRAQDQLRLAEPTLAEQPFDAVLDQRFRAGDDLPRGQQVARRVEADADGRDAAGRGSRCMLQHTQEV